MFFMQNMGFLGQSSCFEVTVLVKLVTLLLVKSLNTSSINLMKVVGAFVKPKGMNIHSKRPSLDLKVIFKTSVGSIGTWW